VAALGRRRWRKHDRLVQVRYRRLVAGRVERVGRRWLAVAGAHYLHEGSSRAHPLRWFPGAQDAALALAPPAPGRVEAPRPRLATGSTVSWSDGCDVR
jgi:hypothetical protein